ncbi:MAG: hypothetical protein N3B21_03800 [Clostridia bacterium]|nr:hypothetical protein [Clostridia bacterium]
MLYKRHPLRHRKYIHMGTDLEETPNTYQNKHTKSVAPDYNTSSTPPATDDTVFGSQMTSLRIFNKQLYMDEILIVGLIFLMFDEGIHDELLVLVLAYLLLAGRE